MCCCGTTWYCGLKSFLGSSYLYVGRFSYRVQHSLELKTVILQTLHVTLHVCVCVCVCVCVSQINNKHSTIQTLNNKQQQAALIGSMQLHVVQCICGKLTEMTVVQCALNSTTVLRYIYKKYNSLLQEYSSYSHTPYKAFSNLGPTVHIQ